MKYKKIAITGAFGYSGKYISEKLLGENYQVKTLTNSPHKHHPYKDKIEIAPLSFDNKDLLVKNLSGYDVLINTYWVRFNHKKFNHQGAVKNTKILFDASKEAKIKKIIHVSITNPDINSELEYFKGKAILEEYLKSLDINYAIIRPAVLFGKEDILINNMAWFVRNLPVIGVFGDGNYKLQPIHVEDFAKLIINRINVDKNVILNAIGKETYTYKQLLLAIMSGIDVHKKIINVNPLVGYWAGKIIGFLKNDVFITKEEIKGLMQNKLYVNDKPIGEISLQEWIKHNKHTLGKKYASELLRRK